MVADEAVVNKVVKKIKEYYFVQIGPTHGYYHPVPILPPSVSSLGSNEAKG
jgi:hypothetical protein